MLAVLLVSFLIVLALGFDIGFSMILAAWLGIQAKTGQPVDAVMMPLAMIAGADTYALVQIPLFILAGEIMNRGGIAQRLIAWSMAFLGHFRGGLGHVSILTNLILSGVSGSASADAVATGTPLIPAMKKEGFPAGYAGAVIAAGALLGPIIPPSISMVIYAQLASQSVVKMFLSGVIPGLLLAAGFMVLCTLIGRRRNYPRHPPADMRQRAIATWQAGWALLMPVLILGGIRFGLFTDTEVAAVAVLYSLAVSLIVYRSIRLAELGGILISAGRSTATILFLVAAAGPFSWLIAESQVNLVIVGAMEAVTSDPILTLFIINLALLAVGTILEPLPAMIIFLPVLLPFATKVGLDPIHFGAVAVINIMIGMLTPPVGILLFISANIGKTSITSVVNEVLPFVGWSFVVLGLIIVFPPLTTWLPSQM